MTHNTKHTSSEDFVAKHYRRDAFSEKEAWKCLNIAPQRKWYQSRVAAAVAAFAVLTASACFYFSNNSANNQATETSVPTTQSVQQTQPASTKVEVIEFADAPLSEVIPTIEKTYGVKVVNVPDEEYRLTLRYEGTATDLINTINEILDLNLHIEE